MFDIPKEGKGSYMRSRQNGGFDRSKFEKQVIDPVCEELAKTEMITLILTPDGKFYEKVKRGNRVIAYKFHWTITDPKAQIEEKEPFRFFQSQDRADGGSDCAEQGSHFLSHRCIPRFLCTVSVCSSFCFFGSSLPALCA